ncbi:aspartate 1-decarboxylase [Marinitoga aeolica]|uniref:Aspartate 1-decarboxylase n=1 Tax=Marinitoga aeolica TaxID=2809031 RepID=A0ABY8PPD6_9BACT|nr:aspartate 1-decarboxylase [Marinitoga aeolica]WGS64504.1 aspartate 1-decarboxylase [Marinitoga aeolica]
MFRILLKGKIHRATVTEKNIHYEGSITVDEELMELADIEENELVQIVDVNNGARFETYVIKGERGSRIIGLNGAAARMVELGDKVIIMAYGLYSKEEKSNPKIVVVDDKNNPKILKNHEEPRTEC